MLSDRTLIISNSMTNKSRKIPSLSSTFSKFNPGKLYQFIISTMRWPGINRFKKHVLVDHCHNFDRDRLAFQKKWWGVSGVYKITFLPFRLFTYYGSSSNLGGRFKYHYFNGPYQDNFLGIFLSVFGWSCFSVSVVELCSVEERQNRENWYLSTFNPLLNMLTDAYNFQPISSGISAITRARISASLTGRTHTQQTKALMSQLRTGAGNPYHGRSLDKKTLDAAVLATATPIYAYDVDTFTLVNGVPFQSIRETAKHLPIGASTLPLKLNTNKPYKGYFYYSTPQASRG